jgi:hypothetical protein
MTNFARAKILCAHREMSARTDHFDLSRRPPQKTVSWRHENLDPQQNFVPERDFLHVQETGNGRPKS